MQSVKLAASALLLVQAWVTRVGAEAVQIVQTYQFLLLLIAVKLLAHGS